MKATEIEFSPASDEEGRYEASYVLEEYGETHELTAEESGDIFEYNIKESIKSDPSDCSENSFNVRLDPQSVEDRTQEIREARESERDNAETNTISVNDESTPQKYAIAELLTKAVINERFSGR